MKRIIVVGILLLLASTLSLSAGERNQADVEAKIMVWAGELADHAKAMGNLNHEADLRKKMADGKYEWLAGHLVVHHEIAKAIAEAFRPKKRNNEKIETEIAKHRKRLATLGWYIMVVNE